MRAWLRGHPRQADVLLAVLLFAVSVGQLTAGPASAASRVAFIAVTVLLAATVVPRRRYPVAAFAAAAVIGAAQIAFGVGPGQAPVFALQPTNTDMVILVLLYTLAAYRPRPVSITGLAVCLLGSAAAIARWAPANGAHPAGALCGAAAGLGGLTLTAWVLGDSVAYRYRRAYYASLEDRAARLEAERDAQARIAAAAERGRIARELHDVIAHNVSVMVVQADGASYALDTDPARAREALAAISATGRQALAEMRRLLGVLRHEGDGAHSVRAPQPGIGELGELLDQARGAGLP